MAWPKKVPILDADDIYKGGLQCGDRMCLRGWAISTFGGAMVGGYGSPSQEAKEVLGLILRDVGRPPSSFNDNNEPAVVAKAWNRAIKKLGYTVPCER